MTGKPREQVDVVVAGGASHVITLASALWKASDHLDVARVGGASAGAIAAAGEAFAISRREQLALMRTVLRDDYLKDRSLNPLRRYGIYKGDNLLHALHRVFLDTRMGDAFIPLRIVVCDLYAREPVIIDSGNPEHKNLRVVDVLRCSAAIPVFFKAHDLPEWRGNRLFVDGGVAANFALGMHDDVPERRTVGIRMSPSPPRVIPVRNIATFAEAVAELLLWSSDNAHVSTKRFVNVVQCPAVGSGLDFNLSDEKFNARVIAGKIAMESALRAWGS